MYCYCRCITPLPNEDIDKRRQIKCWNDLYDTLDEQRKKEVRALDEVLSKKDILQGILLPWDSQGLDDVDHMPVHIVPTTFTVEDLRKWRTKASLLKTKEWSTNKREEIEQLRESCKARSIEDLKEFVSRIVAYAHFWYPELPIR